MSHVKEHVRGRLNSGNEMRISLKQLLPVVLYGYETWFLALTVEQRLRMFENKVIGNIFVVKRGNYKRRMERVTQC